MTHLGKKFCDALINYSIDGWHSWQGPGTSDLLAPVNTWCYFIWDSNLGLSVIKMHETWSTINPRSSLLDPESLAKSSTKCQWLFGIFKSSEFHFRDGEMELQKWLVSYNYLMKLKIQIIYRIINHVQNIRRLEGNTTQQELSQGVRIFLPFKLFSHCQVFHNEKKTKLWKEFFKC